MLRGSLPSGDLPQTSRIPSTPPPPPAESAMNLHSQIIGKDGRKGLIVLPDEEFAASRPPSFPLFISAFQLLPHALPVDVQRWAFDLSRRSLGEDGCSMCIAMLRTTRAHDSAAA